MPHLSLLIMHPPKNCGSLVPSFEVEIFQGAVFIKERLLFELLFWKRNRNIYEGHRGVWEEERETGEVENRRNDVLYQRTAKTYRRFIQDT